MDGRNATIEGNGGTGETVAARRGAPRCAALRSPRLRTERSGAVRRPPCPWRRATDCSFARSSSRIRRIRVFRRCHGRSSVGPSVRRITVPPRGFSSRGESRGGARRARGGKRKRKERESVAYPIQRGILLAPAEANVPRGLPRGREARDGRRESAIISNGRGRRRVPSTGGLGGGLEGVAFGGRCVFHAMRTVKHR